MTTAAYKRWSHPSGETLILLEGVSIDLLSAFYALELLAQEWKSSTYNPVIADALSTTAVVSYARSFTSGRRQRLKIDEDLSV